MIINKFFIKNYYWDVTAIYDFSCSHLSDLIDLLVELDCTNTTIKQIIKNLGDCRLNKGICFSNISSNKSIIVIGKSSSSEEFFNTLIHETFHLTLHISEKFNIDPFSEELAYLAGDLAESQYKYISKFLF